MINNIKYYKNLMIQEIVNLSNALIYNKDLNPSERRELLRKTQIYKFFSIYT